MIAKVVIFIAHENVERHTTEELSEVAAGKAAFPAPVGFVVARIVSPEPGMEIYDPCCGSAGLLVKCEIVLDEKTSAAGKKKSAPLRLHGQEYVAETWAMANINTIIHDMEGQIELGDTFKTASKPPAGPGWIHEIKHDGFRLKARRDPAGVRLLTRRGLDWTGRYPSIAAAVAALSCRSCLIDGEVVICGEDGVPVFDRLRYGRQPQKRGCAVRFRPARDWRQRSAQHTA